MRESVRDFLEHPDQPIVTEDADTVTLALSELVTNALRHCGGTRILDLTT
ncbi:MULTISPECIES: hypothetical protein [unclassified Streptomyces]